MENIEEIQVGQNRYFKDDCTIFEVMEITESITPQVKAKFSDDVIRFYSLEDIKINTVWLKCDVKNYK